MTVTELLVRAYKLGATVEIGQVPDVETAKDIHAPSRTLLGVALRIRGGKRYELTHSVNDVTDEYINACAEQSACALEKLVLDLEV